METASRPKLRIMNSRVTRLGHRRVKPADSFMAVAQTISKTPASKEIDPRHFQPLCRVVPRNERGNGSSRFRLKVRAARAGVSHRRQRS